MNRDDAHLRIGELSRRTGVSPNLLRAWESRYGLLSPGRSAGGLRLFSSEDERRVRSMREHMSAGLSASEAARAALEATGLEPEAPASSSLSDLNAASAELAAAFARLDRGRAERVLDRLLLAYTFETVVTEILMPYLAGVGERWSRGEPTIPEEHLATQVLRSRLMAMKPSEPRAGAPHAVLACPPGEQHDLPLVILAVALERRGWQVALLGADTPIASIQEAGRLLDADCVIVSATIGDHLGAAAPALASLGAERMLYLAGPAVDERTLQVTGARPLSRDPVASAAEVAGA